MAIPKRTIPELKARYKYEPKLRDVYVEGNFDVVLIRWFLERIGMKDVTLYAVDTVEVPSTLPDGIDSAGGSRTRVIRLANALQHDTKRSHVFFIIDMDSDGIAQNVKRPWVELCGDVVRVTDFPAMEMYLFTETTLSKLVRLVAQRTDIDIAALQNELGQALRQMFAVRYTNSVCGFNLKWIEDFSSCCNKKTGYIALDIEDYIMRLVNKNALASQLETFRSQVHAALSKFPGDPRLVSHGHDFFQALRWVLREHGILVIPKTELLERIVVGCVELAELRVHPFWQRLEAELTPKQVTAVADPQVTFPTLQ